MGFAQVFVGLREWSVQIFTRNPIHSPGKNAKKKLNLHQSLVVKLIPRICLSAG